MWKQGKYRPIHPEKYKGDASKIFYRSSWELIFNRHLDFHPHVVSWSSERIIIPYRCKTDGKMHRYYIDYWFRMKNADGTFSEKLIEIKPAYQTVEPKKRRISKGYITEIKTYAKNVSKWEAARAYAKSQGMTFQILTEKDLGFDKK